MSKCEAAEFARCSFLGFLRIAGRATADERPLPLPNPESANGARTPLSAADAPCLLLRACAWTIAMAFLDNAMNSTQLVPLRDIQCALALLLRVAAGRFNARVLAAGLAGVLALRNVRVRADLARVGFFAGPRLVMNPLFPHTLVPRIHCIWMYAQWWNRSTHERTPRICYLRATC